MPGEYLPPVVTQLTGDIGDLIAKVEEAKAAVKSLGDLSGDVEIKFRVDTASLARARTYARQLAATFPDGVIPIKADVNVGSFLAAGAAAKALGAAVSTPTQTVSRGIPIWHRWFDLIHFGLAIFGANLVADTIGIAAFAISAVANFGAVAEAISNNGQTYRYLTAQQKGATDQLNSFFQIFRTATNSGVFTVFNQLLDMVKSHIAGTGSITRQATQATEDFAAKLQVTFGSKSWASLFSSSTGIVKTDLEQLGSTVNAFLQLVPGLLHDFNGMGLFALRGAQGVFELAAKLTEAHPAITRAVYAAYLANRAYKYLWVGMGQGPGPIQRLVGWFASLGGEGGKLTGIFKNFQQFGLVPTLSLLTGMDGPTMAIVGGLALLGGAITAVYLDQRNMTDGIQRTIDSVQTQDKANQYSQGIWEAGAYKLDKLRESTIKASGGIQNLAHVTAVQARFGTEYNSSIDRITQAYDVQRQGANNLVQGIDYLKSTYGLTTRQAIQLAQATGTQLTAGITGTGQSAVEARDKIKAYEQQLNATKNSESAVQYGMQQAANTALQLDDRITGLTNAFNALLTPFANTIYDTAKWRDDNVTLAQDLKKSNDQVGYGTAAQRTSAQALAISIRDTEQLSQDILNQTGNTNKATGAIQREITFLKGLHSNSEIVKQAIKDLEAYLGKLHSKYLQIHISGSGSFGISTGLQRQIPGPRAARGAFVREGSGPTADDVLARVSRGEVIVPAHMVRAGLVNHLRGHIPGFGGGGIIPSYSGNVQGEGPWAYHNYNATISAFASSLGKAMQASIPRGSSGGRSSAGGQYNRSMLENLWQQAGGPGGTTALIAAAIALAESGGNPFARNPSGSSGLWQILGQVYPGNIFNPFINALNAVSKFDSAHGFSPWVTYTTGAYRAFMDNGGWLPPGQTLVTNNTGQPERVLAPGEHEVIEIAVYLDGKQIEKVVQTRARRYNRRNGIRGTDRWAQPA